ncbi:ABC transporter permease [Candidatus Dependentiae bacterium]|nr:ABC transporter permease [Candidatus Dependentiae bacterium]
MKKKFGSYVLPLACILTYAFLYTPIIILIIFSFNYSQSPFIWKGFSLRWYTKLFQSVEIVNALKNSFIVALSAMILSIILGTLFIFYSARSFLGHTITLFYASLATPDIVLAVSLLSIFSFLFVPLGLITLIVSHTLIGLGYVIPIIKARFEELDTRFTEASLDLGATETQTLVKVIIPQLSPALIAAGLLVFILSLDDFIIAFFCSGGATQTLPMFIYSMIRAGSTPVVSALSTLLLGISGVIVLILSLLQTKKTGMLQ